MARKKASKRKAANRTRKGTPARKAPRSRKIPAASTPDRYRIHDADERTQRCVDRSDAYVARVFSKDS